MEVACCKVVLSLNIVDTLGVVLRLEKKKNLLGSLKFLFKSSQNSTSYRLAQLLLTDDHLHVPQHMQMHNYRFIILLKKKKKNKGKNR